MFAQEISKEWHRVYVKKVSFSWSLTKVADQQSACSPARCASLGENVYADNVRAALSLDYSQRVIF